MWIKYAFRGLCFGVVLGFLFLMIACGKKDKDGVVQVQEVCHLGYKWTTHGGGLTPKMLPTGWQEPCYQVGAQ